MNKFFFVSGPGFITATWIVTKTVYSKQYFDDVAWERSDIAREEAEKLFRKTYNCLALKALIEKHCGRQGDLGRKLVKGSLNIIYQMCFEGHQDVILRILFPGASQFPDQKILAEVATMRCLTQNTTVPIPALQDYGLSEQNPTGLGPFVIMDYIINDGTLAEAIKNLNPKEIDEQPTLDPNVPEAKLEHLYRIMAGYVLQISTLEFPSIGSLMPTHNGKVSYTVAACSMSMNINTMRELANVPPIVLPPKDKIYTTSDEWYLALAEMHIAQLLFQHNDLTSSKDDCRNKYVARQLFRQLAKDGKLSTFGFADDHWSVQSERFRSSSCSNRTPELSSAPSREGPFRLWCDDLHGGNVLLDKNLDVAAVIDWEFAYVGPTQFSLNPPWWLLLGEPEVWPDGIEEWRKIYDVRLKTWLRAMEQAEDAAEETKKG